MGYYPGRFAVGTIRKVAYSLKMSKGQETESGWGRFMDEVFKWFDKRAKQKRAKQKLSKKHKVDFS